jgi:hypothetical protein
MPAKTNAPFWEGMRWPMTLYSSFYFKGADSLVVRRAERIHDFARQKPSVGLATFVPVKSFATDRAMGVFPAFGNQ